MAKRENLKIGDVIKRARERKELTADEVAALCNVSRAMVYQWEGSSFILRKNFPALSAALGISIKHLNRVNGKRQRNERDGEGLAA